MVETVREFRYLRLVVAALVLGTITACGLGDGSPVSSTPDLPSLEPSVVPTSDINFTANTRSAMPTVTATPMGDAPDVAPTVTLTPTREDVTYSRRTPFVPLDNPAFLISDEATYLANEDLVLGLEWAGRARAYPIRMVRFHHIVNDIVADRPLLITY